MADAVDSRSSPDAIAAADAPPSSPVDRSEAECVTAVKAIEADRPIDVQRRLEVIERLLAVQGTSEYGTVQRQAARSLGITVRSVQRLVKAWREHGVAGVCKQSRRDRGEHKVSYDWQQFIVKTYREGNRGSRRLSAAQVAVRVQVRAAELGVSDQPGRTTVYRILQPHIEKAKPAKRSIGWRGDGLSLKTGDGLEIPIRWSNQVWQVDHTQADVLVVDQSGTLLGRPWLTIVVDTYSRCVIYSVIACFLTIFFTMLNV